MKKAAFIALLLNQCQPCPADVVSESHVVRNTLFAEARSEGRRGIEAVASVIQNRAERSGKSLEAVCLARRQFSCWNGGYYQPEPQNEQERQILAFCEGLESQMRAGKFKPLGNWTHYYNGSLCSPSWAGDLEEVETIGRHTFGKERAEK